MRGSAITARKPAASTVPSTELSASLLTTSGAGRWARVTEITSSSSRDGATRNVLRLDETLDDQGQSGDRADEQRPDRPASRLYYRKQYGPFPAAASDAPDAFAARGLWRELRIPLRQLRRLRAACRTGRFPTGLFIHRSRGQLCGQLGCAATQLQSWRGLEWIAKKLSTKISFQIKGLLRQHTSGKAISPLLPSIGAAVESSSRAGAGFADD